MISGFNIQLLELEPSQASNSGNQGPKEIFDGMEIVQYNFSENNMETCLFSVLGINSCNVLNYGMNGYL